MDLDLTPDQELLRDTTRKFLHATVPLTAVRALAENPAGFDREWWQRGAELGWTSLLVDERRGGGSISGAGLRDLALIAEEMGAMVSPGPLIATNVVAQTLSRDASEDLASHVLPSLLSGESVAAWCVAEPGREITPDGMTLRARRDGAEFVLDGVKRPVDTGGQADWLLVTAVAPESLSQFLVPASAPGLQITPLRGLDLVRKYAEVRFDGVRVPASAVVGVVGGASLSFEAQLQTTLVLQCAEIVGATDRVFDFTVQYAFDRSSFGRALASYQALKHRFADMKLWLESAHAITVDATRAVQDGAPEAGEVVRIAKAYVAERCPELIQDCIQMHGGIGVTWEHDLHLYLRRVVVHRQTYGDPLHQRDRVAILADREGTTMTVTTAAPGGLAAEDLDTFRARAEEWVTANLEPLNGADPYLGHATDDADHVVRAKAIQRKIFDAGFAGLCYPVEYGGRGLPAEYQDAFIDVTYGYELPRLFNTPTFTIILPTILDFGTEEQKKRFIPAALKGEELWVQFLSEPTGGSDLAGALTRADRRDGVFILNGSKIWSTYAWKSDYALCVARTDWDVPKHKGLSVLIVKVHQPGITITQIKHVDGTDDFCQEFFDDVAVPADQVLGQVDDGWNVASRLLLHEREAMSGSSPYAMAPRTAAHENDQVSAAALAQDFGGAADARVRQLIGEARVLTRVHTALVGRIATSIRTGRLPAAAGSIPRLSNGMMRVRLASIALEIAGDRAVAWTDGDRTGDLGVAYLGRQGPCIGGGTTEITRNIISERVLGMPRECAEDLDRPFRDVRTNAAVPRHQS